MWYRDGRMREYEAWSCDDVQELARNVTSHGVPTMRPLAYEFPADPKCRGGLNDQYMLGPNLST